jgi:uncharacterized membrane protein
LFLQHRRSSCTKFTKFSNLTLSALVFIIILLFRAVLFTPIQLWSCTLVLKLVLSLYILKFYGRTLPGRYRVSFRRWY